MHSETNPLANPLHRPTLLVIDDEPLNLQVIRQVLHADFRLVFAKDGRSALALATAAPPDLVLLDVMMPGMTGYEVCRELKADERTRHVPVIFVTALSHETDETLGLELGAVDYLTKPISAGILKARVRTHLSLVRIEELKQTRLQAIRCLGVAAEYKDNETGGHVIRMSHYAQALALMAGYGLQQADDLFHAAPMHDIGKIGIPDAILKKPGALTDTERDVMQTHPRIGAEILGDHPSTLFRMARAIALTHHEKWDGSGYPNGLAGADIPHVGRIVALADVFDALTSARPYKPAWPVAQAMAWIRSQSGSHFDPELVDLLERNLDEFTAIQARWSDAGPGEGSVSPT
ncbi:HD-GYP domain-containing protein [Variovorax ginsengisoli]|uniref:Two-component system response regulator n=1 Tax=Variovorax ginsengisoli TaxID=363844 RepID=A0ABT9S8J9_9BURK|nr:HD domain-containing phosphohydrolase [Variovorax ginsengisoli]MDP9900183.1 putative two-component system response regulator [Variovorax ginsengisoli]